MSSDIRKYPVEVGRYENFSELPKEVSAGIARRSGLPFFASIEWFNCLHRFGFVEAKALRLYAGSNSGAVGHPVSLMCLMADGRRSRLSSLTNYYSIVFPGLSIHGEPTNRIFDEVVRAIRRDEINWSEIEIRSLSENSPDTDKLLSAFAEAGYKINLFHQYWNWFASVDGLSYATFLAARPSRVRNTLRRKAGRVASDFRFRISIFKSPDDVASALPDYLAVYARSWKPQERPGSFIPELIKLCAEQGILRLGILYLDDEPVAVQFWITDRKTAYIYKLAYDQRYADYSVGSILTARMFEYAIDIDAVAEINFGTGDEAYKRDWVDDRRQVFGAQMLNCASLRGLLLQCRVLVRDYLRQIGLRQFTPVPVTPGDKRAGNTPL